MYSFYVVRAYSFARRTRCLNDRRRVTDCMRLFVFVDKTIHNCVQVAHLDTATNQCTSAVTETFSSHARPQMSDAHTNARANAFHGRSLCKRSNQSSNFLKSSGVRRFIANSLSWSRGLHTTARV